MTEELTTAKRELLKIVDDLESIAFRLRGVHASLPEELAEAIELLDLDEMEPATELRSVIACVLHDFIESTIRDLRDAVGVRNDIVF